MLRPILACTAGAAALLALIAWTASPPVRGPGGVIDMHKALFTAIDAGDTEAALRFLHGDMNMKSKHAMTRRPCTLVLPGKDGAGSAAVGRAKSGKALASFIASEGSDWHTEILSAQADCPSSDASWAVFEIERTRSNADGTVMVKRFNSSSIVAHDGDFTLTHWHLSPAALPASARKTAGR